MAELAAADATGVARNHPFVDGNKRTAFVVMELFIGLHGHRLSADDASCVTTMLGVASGDMSEQVLADWIREHLLAS